MSTLLSAVLQGNTTLAGQMSISAFVADQDAMADKVLTLRAYADGDHRANLTAEMRKLLRINDAGSFREFNDNYMPLVINAEADRLEVTGIEADADEASAWAGDVLNDNRFDGMQGDVHASAIRDGDTYVLVDWDNVARRARLTHEPAFDGTAGIVAIHNDPRSTQPDVAIKLWALTTESIADTVRINVFYPDRIEKFIARDGGSPTPFAVDGEAWPAPWKLPDGTPIGVPVVHFRNRAASYHAYGQSEIEDAIPLQDALNRTLYSMIMAAELSAFGIRYAAGFDPPADLTPGMWIKIAKDGLSKDDAWAVGTLEGSPITPYIDQARWLADQIGKITATPLPEFMGGDTASGEALKQREISLLGKVRRFQLKAGNAWEDVMALAHRVQAAYGIEKPPAYTRFTARWRDAEIRNDKATVEAASLIADRIGDREFLRIVAPIYGWDEAKIAQILAEKRADAGADLAAMANTLPDFGGFSSPTTLGGNGNGESGEALPAAAGVVV